MARLRFLLLFLAAFLPLAASQVGARALQGLNGLEISPQVKTMLVSAVPILELRGAIPYGTLWLHLSWTETFFWAILGNMLPIPLVLLFFGYLEKMLGRWAWGQKLVQKLNERTRNRTRSIERYKELGLMLFVAVPLPMTGAWTGAMAAQLFGWKIHKSLLYIFLGVLIAGAVVTTLVKVGLLGFNLITN